MKNLFVLFIILFPTMVFAQVAWTPVDYKVTVKVKNKDITVTERFVAYKVDFRFSPDNLVASHFKATIHVTTAITGKNDGDLNKQYIDTGKYTQADIESTSLYTKGTGYAGKFNITVKGVTRQVEIPFEFKQTGDDGQFTSSFNINSRNFGEGIQAFTMNQDALVSIFIKATNQNAKE